jgi:predicted DNA-binding transcriptional regulator YafY
MARSDRRLLRIFELDRLLRSRHIRHTYQSLVEALQEFDAVNQRTIQSDLDFLKDLGAPIDYARNGCHNYSDPNWPLGRIAVKEGEILALVAADRLLTYYANSPYIQELRQGLQRLCERLDGEVMLNAQDFIADRQWVQQKVELNLNLEILQALEQACRQYLQVAITYHTAGSNQTSERQVDPYGLVVSNESLQLVAFCHKRQEVRNFRVDRILELQVLEQHFELQSGFSLKKYMSTAFRWEVGETERRVVVEFDRAIAPFVRGRQWHSTQELTDLPGGGLLLSMRVSGLLDVAQWVLSYGKGAIAREPPELVRAIAQAVETMHHQYETEAFER